MDAVRVGSQTEEPQAPEVSIVIPAYNQADYLAGAIESALSQTYGNLEVIVVDDGSTDKTADITLQYYRRQRHSRRSLRYVWQRNAGLAAARNTGLRYARGRYVGLLDSDDEWLPTYLEQMFALVERYPQAAVYYCQVYYMDESGQSLPQQSDALVPPPEQMYATLLRKNFLVPSTILMRREAALAVGGFDPDFRRLQDWELWLRMLQQGYRFAGTDQRLVRYRLHDSSLSTDPTGGQQAVMALVIKLFGPDDERYPSWAQDKRRAYGGAYRYHAITALQYSGDWQAMAGFLRKALQADPSLAQDVDLFYELLLGPQPLGYRGTRQRLQLEDNAAYVFEALERTFRNPSPELEPVKRTAWGTALLAAGLLAYNLGNRAASRKYLTQALMRKPGFLRQRRVAAAWFKSLVSARSSGPPTAAQSGLTGNQVDAD